MAFEDILTSLDSLGFYDFLLPWLFTFAVVYGLLMMVKVFGEGNKKIPTALALVIAFFVTGYSGPSLAKFFSELFGGAAMIIAGILVILLFLAMVGFKPDDIKKTGAMIVLIVVGVVLWMVSSGAASGKGFLPLMSPDLVAIILVLVVIILAVWAITREGKSGEAPKRTT